MINNEQNNESRADFKVQTITLINILKETAKDLSEKHTEQFIVQEHEEAFGRPFSLGSGYFKNGYEIARKTGFWPFNSFYPKLWVPFYSRYVGIKTGLPTRKTSFKKYIKNNGLEIISSSDEVFETFMSNYEKSELSTVLKNNNIKVFRNSHYFKK